MASTTQGIKLDPETQRRLKRLGAQKDRSPHWIMKTAIQEYLEREEAAEQERQEDAERWQRYLDSGAFIGNDEMMAWMDGLAAEAHRRARSRAGAGASAKATAKTRAKTGAKTSTRARKR